MENEYVQHVNAFQDFMRAEANVVFLRILHCSILLQVFRKSISLTYLITIHLTIAHLIVVMMHTIVMNILN